MIERQRLPRTIENDFSERHIHLIWNELHDRFGFDIKLWKKKFDAELDQQVRNVNALSFFLTFGNKYINPILNGILCRKELHNTFNKLVEYVVKSK